MIANANGRLLLSKKILYDYKVWAELFKGVYMHVKNSSLLKPLSKIPPSYKMDGD